MILRGIFVRKGPLTLKGQRKPTCGVHFEKGRRGSKAVALVTSVPMATKGPRELNPNLLRPNQRRKSQLFHSLRKTVARDFVEVIELATKVVLNRMGLTALNPINGRNGRVVRPMLISKRATPCFAGTLVFRCRHAQMISMSSPDELWKTINL